MFAEIERENTILVYPEIVPQKSNPSKSKREAYLIARAMLHLRNHFTQSELAVIFHRSKKFIYMKLKELR